MKRQYVKAALRAANAAREILGLPPVKKLYPGRPASAAACAITATIIDDDFDVEKYGVATSSYVNVYERKTGKTMVWMPLDSDALEFTARFDSNKYPNLTVSTERPLSERVRLNQYGGVRLTDLPR